MQVKFNKLNSQYHIIKDRLLPRLFDLFEDSSFINGGAVHLFEQNFAKYIGAKYAVGVSNGTDALKLAAESLKLVNPTFFIPANTFIATYSGLEEAYPNANFVLVDCNDDYLIDIPDLERKISDFSQLPFRTDKVIVPVHLYGNSCDIGSILDISSRYGCFTIEDCAQSHGTLDITGNKVGSRCHVSCFSFYPGKNLGAFGDAGMVLTNDIDVYNRLLKLRNLGSTIKYQHEIKGHNNRLDSVQAIILDEKLKYLDEWNCQRINVAESYYRGITNPEIKLPCKSKYCLKHTYHIFCIRHRDRDSLMSYLNANGIETGIHYPILIEDMPMYSWRHEKNINAQKICREIVSLPMHPFLSIQEIEYTCNKINEVKA